MTCSNIEIDVSFKSPERAGARPAVRERLEADAERRRTEGSDSAEKLEASLAAADLRREAHLAERTDKAGAYRDSAAKVAHKRIEQLLSSADRARALQERQQSAEKARKTRVLAIEEASERRDERTARVLEFQDMLRETAEETRMRLMCEQHAAEYRREMHLASVQQRASEECLKVDWVHDRVRIEETISPLLLQQEIELKQSFAAARRDLLASETSRRLAMAKIRGDSVAQLMRDKENIEPLMNAERLAEKLSEAEARREDILMERTLRARQLAVPRVSPTKPSAVGSDETVSETPAA